MIEVISSTLTFCAWMGIASPIDLCHKRSFQLIYLEAINLVPLSFPFELSAFEWMKNDFNKDHYDYYKDVGLGRDQIYRLETKDNIEVSINIRRFRFNSEINPPLILPNICLNSW